MSIDTIIELDGVQMVRLLGPQDRLLGRIEREFPDVDVQVRGNRVQLTGEDDAVHAVERLILELAALVNDGVDASEAEVSAGARLVREDSPSTLADALGAPIVARAGKSIRPKTPGQRDYVDAIDDHTIVFGIGPAGTGKTYLAMAKAVQALQRKEVTRIILTRPAVEAGERLGFLPGTLTDKIDPYLRPLFDALNEMMEPELVPKLLAANVVEVAPLAYMRGRTLNDAFVVLDEAQNTTPEQMKMFLTRLGFGSKMVVTGDVTQIDLPDAASGLVMAQRVLDEVDDIHFAMLTSDDVVRHTLVGRIVDAYTRYDEDRQRGAHARADRAEREDAAPQTREERRRGQQRADWRQRR